MKIVVDREVGRTLGALTEETFLKLGINVGFDDEDLERYFVGEIVDWYFVGIKVDGFVKGMEVDIKASPSAWSPSEAVELLIE